MGQINYEFGAIEAGAGGTKCRNTFSTFETAGTENTDSMQCVGVYRTVRTVHRR